MDIAPLRTLDDFLLGQARFQLPDVKNEDRWFNRIVSNLLYYQTNYILSAFILFLLVTFFHPQEMVYGIGVMVILLGLTSYAKQQTEEFNNFQKNHPFVFALGFLAIGYIIIYKLGCVIVLLLGVMLPITFTIIHASLRMRNTKNKLVNVSQAFGVSKSSPMSLLLDQLGIEPDLKYL